MIILATIDVLPKIVQSVERQLLYYTAKWCKPCQLLAPELDKLDESNTLKIIKVDVDECPEWTDKQRINTVPSLQIWENGKVIRKIDGCCATDLQMLCNRNELP